MKAATPGPWTARNDPLAPDRGKVFVEGQMGWEKEPVCSSYENYDTDINEASARLIAAAPDLLIACKSMRATMYSPHSEQSKLADAAIAKAEGN